MSTNFKDQPIKKELFERFNQEQSRVFALINEQYETLLEFAKYQEHFFNQLPKYNRTNPVNFRAALKERCGLDFDRIICKLQSYSYRQEEMLKAILGQCYDAERDTKLGNPLEQWGILNAEKKYKPNDIYPWRACIPDVLPLVLNEITQRHNDQNDQNEKPLQEEQEEFEQTLLSLAKDGEKRLACSLYDLYGIKLEAVKRFFQRYDDVTEAWTQIKRTAKLLSEKDHSLFFKEWSIFLNKIGIDVKSCYYSGDIDTVKGYSEHSAIGIEYHPFNVSQSAIRSISPIYTHLLQYLEKPSLYDKQLLKNSENKIIAEDISKKKKGRPRKLDHEKIKEISYQLNSKTKKTGLPLARLVRKEYDGKTDNESVNQVRDCSAFQPYR